MIKKIGANKWRLYSKDGKKNLGTFGSLAAAKKHEKEVQYFKHKSQLEALIGKTIENILSEKYYNISKDNPPSIKEILEKWMQGDKVYDPDDNFHAFYDIEELSNIPSGNPLRYKPGSEEFKELMLSILKDGIKQPLVVMLGKNGQVKLGEGNHRLAAAKELYIRANKLPPEHAATANAIKNKVSLLPIRFEFWQEVKS